MAGALPYYKLGPASYIAGKAITGGQLVRAAAGNESGVTADLQGASVVPNDSLTSTTLLGVALTDAGISQYPEGTANTSTPLDTATLPYTVAVGNNMDMRVLYSGTATFGAPVYADASGHVTGTQGTNAVLVGRCTEPGGITGSPSTSAPVLGRAFIRV